jgi:hypothetical protein
MGSVNWDGGGITILFPLVSNVHLTSRSVVKVGKKVICGLQTPKMLTSASLTIKNYYILRNGNRNTSGCAKYLFIRKRVIGNWWYIFGNWWYIFGNWWYFLVIDDTFLREAVYRCHEILKGIHGTRKVKNSWPTGSVPTCSLFKL